MSFDYKHTCYAINKEITNFQDHAPRFIRELLQAYDECELESERETLITEQADILYNEYAEEVFETTRTTNEDMRTAAEEQIDELTNEKEESDELLRLMEEDKEELEEEILQKDDLITNLEYELKHA